MKWILIVYAFAGAAPGGMTTAEFDTLTACHKAIKGAKSLGGIYHKVNGVCVPKGAPARQSDRLETGG